MVRKRSKQDKEKRLERLVLKTYDAKSPGSYGGLARLQKATGVPMVKIKSILSRNLPYTLHKPVRQRYATNPTVALGVDHQWVADLVDMQRMSRQNKGYKYLVTVIDVLSKYAWAIPIKNKTGQELKRAFEVIFKEGRQPVQLQTDKGSEFYNKTFQNFLKDKNIHLFSTHGDTKAATVERFNRTLKARMYRALTANNTLTYVTMLPDLVKGYNAAKHRSIGMLPKDVTPQNDRRIWKTLCAKRLRPLVRFQFNVGDKVRLSKVRRVFKKSYLPGWMEEVFVIRRRLTGPVPSYHLQEYDGTDVKGTFYEPELQKVEITEDAFFRVEKVLKRRGNQVYVQWKGWPSKYNSWINKKDLVTIGDRKT